MPKTVVALFDDYSDAQQAVDALIAEGFRREDVNITSRDAGPTGGAYDNASRAEDADDNRSFGDKVSHFFGSLFGTEDEDYKDHYSEAVRRGGAVVTVNTDERMVARATDILDRYDPADIDERAAYYRESGYTGFDASTPAYTDEEVASERESYRNRLDDRGEVRIPVVEEGIDVGKREVRRGGVRVHNRIEEVPVEQDVRLREERVHVDRRPVDRPVTDADFDTFKEGTIEVTETAEEPVVSKRARVAEEVVINKEVGERTETVRDTVRRTDVDVEDIEGDRDIASKKARNLR